MVIRTEWVSLIIINFILMAFEVDNIDDAVRHLDRLGVPHEPVRTDPCTGRRFLFFTAPARLPLELYEKD